VEEEGSFSRPEFGKLSEALKRKTPGFKRSESRSLPQQTLTKKPQTKNLTYQKSHLPKISPTKKPYQ